MPVCGEGVGLVHSMLVRVTGGDGASMYGVPAYGKGVKLGVKGGGKVGSAAGDRLVGE